MSKDFVNFHNHTTYSLMDSLVKTQALFAKTKELGYSAVSVTDHGTLAGAWDALKASKETGVKLIMGCEFYFVDDLSVESHQRLRHVILLAKNHQGYKNLLLAHKLANDNNIILFKKAVPRIDWKILEQCSEGLICTTACGEGILANLINNRKSDKAKEQAKRLKDIFGDNLALEIQPHNMRRNLTPYNDYEDQALVNRQLIKFGNELDIKVICTSNTHYLTKDDHEAHDVMLAIGSGQQVKSQARLKYDNEFYLRSREEMEQFFSRLYKEKAQDFCDNTLYFSSLCEQPDWIDPKFTNPSGKELPEFQVNQEPNYEIFSRELDKYSAELSEDQKYLRWLCDQNFAKKVPAGKEQEYRDRLQEEFDVIEYHNFSSYMLIVADYVQFARKNNIPVGPGRGSIGGSLIAYLIGIHQADPIKYGLIFARFHNKAKASFPDIDLDFATSGRDLVQKYISEKYGFDNVAHVSNVNTMTPKVYARDIARCFEFGGDRKAAVAIGTAIADSIPAEFKSIEDALEGAPLFAEYANHPKYIQLSKYAKLLNGKAKAWSTHAAGIVIGRRPLTEIVPTRKDKDCNFAIEYEKERAESNGLVKMDILGLETLDIIMTTNQIIKSLGKDAPEVNYEEYDQKAYDLISRGDTLCVFQLGTSGGTTELCKKIRPKNIEDIAIINALARPSAKDMREDFVKARNGEIKVELLHPNLERAFGPTYGFGLYEECLMYLAQDVAGWDLHDADKLRKLTKEKGKNPKKVAGWKEEFISGALNNKDITEKTSREVWETVISNFQGYGFNKSHAVLYSMISYHTAYLKAHFPLEFLTANLISEVNSNAKAAEDNIAKIKGEIRKMNVRIIPPNINESDVTYKIIDDHTLMTGLDSLKFIGKDAIPEILAKRPFTSFEDFLSKVDGRKVKAPSLLALSSSGALDEFKMSRKQVFLYSADYKKKFAVWLKRNKEKQISFNYPWPTDVGEWTAPEKFAMEMFYMGEGLSNNLFEIYPKFFNRMAENFSTLADRFPQGFGEEKTNHKAPGLSFQGIIKSFFEFRVKKETSKIYGEQMVKMIVQDPFGNSLPVTIFPKGLKILKDKLKSLGLSKLELSPGVGLHMAASINWYEGEISLLFEDLFNACAPPQKPNDLKPRKVSMKLGRVKKGVKDLELEDILNEIDEELIEEGLDEETDFDEEITEDFQNSIVIDELEPDFHEFAEDNKDNP